MSYRTVGPLVSDELQDGRSSGYDISCHFFFQAKEVKRNMREAIVKEKKKKKKDKKVLYDL